MQQLGIKTPHLQVESILSSFTHPTLQQSLIAMNALDDCTIANSELSITLRMPFAWQSVFAQLKEAVSIELLAKTHTKKINWSLNYKIATLKRANTVAGIKNIKNIIAIGSGKGGVGKSSTAINVALALQKEGVNVGLLDADIYGPSLPTMLGTACKQAVSPDNQHMLPIMAFDLATNSIGYLIEKNNATVWRGPMASKALMQMLTDTLWPALDYLIIDMPPGTGDIQLTLAQSIPVTGAVIVTTPQDIALIDAMKGLNMFNRVQVPTIGIIENMSYFACEHCGELASIFGEGGAKRISSEYGAQLLGQVPLHRFLRVDLDNGTPTVIKRPDSTLTKLYTDIAVQLAAELYWQGKPVQDDIAVKLI